MNKPGENNIKQVGMSNNKKKKIQMTAVESAGCRKKSLSVSHLTVLNYFSYFICIDLSLKSLKSIKELLFSSDKRAIVSTIKDSRH